MMIFPICRNLISTILSNLFQVYRIDSEDSEDFEVVEDGKTKSRDFEVVKDGKTKSRKEKVHDLKASSIGWAFMMIFLICKKI